MKKCIRACSIFAYLVILLMHLGLAPVNTALESTPESAPESTPETTPENTPVPEATPETTPEVLPERSYSSVIRTDIIDASSIVVNNFSEFSSALSANNGYTTVYLGGDIVMTGGITIHSSKANVVIDGISPLDPSGDMHRLTDRVSIVQTDTVYINSANIKSLTVRNLSITGRNYFGSFSVLASLDVTLTYQNVSYLGPQLTYNRNGTTRYIDCTLNITETNGNTSIVVEELGEVKRVVFGGNVSVTGSSATTSLLWFLGSGCTFEVLEGANVFINVMNGYMIYSDGGQVACTVGRGARLTIFTKYGLFYNMSATLHQFAGFTIHEGASVDIEQSVKNAHDGTTATVKVRGGLSVDPGASLYVKAAYASANALICFMANGAGANFLDPDTVLLSNVNGRLFGWSTGSGLITIEAGVVDYWTSAAALSELKNFSRMPQYYWSKADGENIELSALVSRTSTSNVTSNFERDVDYGEAPSAATMDMAAARMLSFGRMPVFTNQPTADTRTVSGFSVPGANVKMDYTADGAAYTSAGVADATGGIAIPLPESHYLETGSALVMTAHSNYKIRTVRNAVLEGNTKVLAFQYVPEHLDFETTGIASGAVIVPRKNPDWSIGVMDTRDQGSPWTVYADVLQPLVSTDGQNRTLPNAVCYIDENGAKHVLNGNTRVFSGVKGRYDDTILSWGHDKGIIIEIPPGVAYSTSYTAKIQWTLLDAP